VLFAMGRGPVMLYHGQEVGEPALGEEGFGGDDARTTIFDYWSMPEFTKWVNGGKFDGARLNDEQKELRQWYAGMLNAIKAPAFTAGEFYGLNHANNGNPDFGRLGDETASGHWLYAFLRHDATSGQSFLVVANFHGGASLKNVKIQIPDNAREFLGRTSDEAWKITCRFGGDWIASITTADLTDVGIALPEIPACSAMFVEITEE